MDRSCLLVQLLSLYLATPTVWKAGSFCELRLETKNGLLRTAPKPHLPGKCHYVIIFLIHTALLGNKLFTPWGSSNHSFHHQEPAGKAFYINTTCAFTQNRNQTARTLREIINHFRVVGHRRTHEETNFFPHCGQVHGYYHREDFLFSCVRFDKEENLFIKGKLVHGQNTVFAQGLLRGGQDHASPCTTEAG